MWFKDPALPAADSPRRPFVLAAGALVAAMLTLSAVTLLARRTFERLERGSEARQQAYDVLIALRRLRQDVGEMRVGVTGYVFTNDSAYLATYRRGHQGLARDTTRLRELTAGTPSLHRELTRLQPELIAYATDLEAGLRAVRARPRPSLPPQVLSRSGLLLEQIGPHFVAIEAEQMRLLDAGALEVRAAVERTNSAFTWVLLFDGVLAVSATLLLYLHLRARARTEAQLARAQEQLQESRRLEAIGQLAGGVAHDFNNILTVMTSLSDLMGEALAEEHPVQSDIVLLREATHQGIELTHQLLAFGRRQVLDLRVVELNDVVTQFRPLLDLAIPESITVSMHLAADLGRVRADPVQLEQVLMNFTVNARDAMVGGGRLTVETANAEIDDSTASSRPDVKPGRYVVLIVSDTGTGMDAATQARIFEPFFTTKEFGRGTGLGLATVYGIVKQSGGHVWLYSEPSHGTTFKVYLPRVDDDAAPPDAGAGRPAITGSKGTETILLVEDDRRVRDVTLRILAGAGYRVLPATSPAEALELLGEHGAEPIHLLLTDVVLPGMSGPQLAREVLARSPKTRVLFQSGYSDAALAHHGALDGGAPLLHKPFTSKALTQRVREVLDAPGPAR